MKTGIFGSGEAAGVLFFAGLLPVRMVEWFLLLKIAFGERTRDKSLTAPAIGFGILVSYLLDFVGIIAAFVLPGGMWVC